MPCVQAVSAMPHPCMNHTDPCAPLYIYHITLLSPCLSHTLTCCSDDREPPWLQLLPAATTQRSAVDYLSIGNQLLFFFLSPLWPAHVITSGFRQSPAAAGLSTSLPVCVPLLSWGVGQRQCIV